MLLTGLLVVVAYLAHVSYVRKPEKAIWEPKAQVLKRTDLLNYHPPPEIVFRAVHESFPAISRF